MPKIKIILGVIFALKVLAADTKLYDTANVTFCEMSINYVCWLELIVIQVRFFLTLKFVKESIVL